jgi:hypothetical protein
VLGPDGFFAQPKGLKFGIRLTPGPSPLKGRGEKMTVRGPVECGGRFVTAIGKARVVPVLADDCSVPSGRNTLREPATLGRYHSSSG